MITSKTPRTIPASLADFCSDVGARAKHALQRGLTTVAVIEQGRDIAAVLLLPHLEPRIVHCDNVQEARRVAMKWAFPNGR